MTDLAGAGDAVAATPGATLAAVRKANGLSVNDVAGEMRISPRQVEAIEADRYKDLPGPVFVRGFIRNYARLLKLDPVPLLHALEAQLGDDVPLRGHHIAGTMPGDSKRGHLRAWGGLLAGVTMIVVGAGGYELWRTRAEPDSQPKAEKKVLTQAAPVQSVTQRGASLPPAAPAGTTHSGGDLAGSANANVEPATSVPADTERRREPAAAQPPAAGLRRIELQFARDSWVEIRGRDGGVVYSGTGVTGTSGSWDVAAPVEVAIGNVAGVRITYNGRPVDLTMYAQRNTARLTLE